MSNLSSVLSVGLKSLEDVDGLIKSGQISIARHIGDFEFGKLETFEDILKRFKDLSEVYTPDGIKVNNLFAEKYAACLARDRLYVKAKEIFDAITSAGLSGPPLDSCGYYSEFASKPGMLGYVGLMSYARTAKALGEPETQKRALWQIAVLKTEQRSYVMQDVMAGALRMLVTDLGMTELKPRLELADSLTR